MIWCMNDRFCVGGVWAKSFWIIFHIMVNFVIFFQRLTFEFDPSSRVHNFHSHPLKPGGEQEDVTMDNVEEYIDLVLDFCFVSGIRRQMEAFRSELLFLFLISLFYFNIWPISFKFCVFGYVLIHIREGTTNTLQFPPFYLFIYRIYQQRYLPSKKIQDSKFFFL